MARTSEFDPILMKYQYFDISTTFEPQLKQTQRMELYETVSMCFPGVEKGSNRPSSTISL